jgi:hypothetical protein
MLDVYEKLRFQQWWTREKGLTSMEGTWEMRAFLGKHRLTVGEGDNAATLEVELRDNGDAVTEVTVVLP